MHCLDGRNRLSFRRPYAEECGPRNKAEGPKGQVEGPKEQVERVMQHLTGPFMDSSTFSRRSDRPHPPTPALSFEREKLRPPIL
jgi:hypothetical protein